MAGAGVRASATSNAAAADFFGSLGPSGYASYPMDIDEPLGPAEVGPEPIQPEVPEEPMDSPVHAPAPGPADLPAGAMSKLGGDVHLSCIANSKLYCYLPLPEAKGKGDGFYVQEALSRWG